MAIYKPQYKDSNGQVQDLNLKAKDTDLFDSKEPSYYLNYNNLTNKPSIPSIANCVKYGDVIMNTNPFGGKLLYINSVDNAFANADKKFWVTVTKHSKSSGGVTYPYADTTKDITADDYFVDGPVLQTLTSSAHNLFDGSYESQLSCSAGQYLKIRIMFGSNTSPSGSSSYFPGYPYGTYYISFYYNQTPETQSQVRVYNRYAAHTVGWHLYNTSTFNGTLGSTNVIQSLSDGNDYQRTCIEFIIFGNETSGRTVSPTELDYKLSRPDLSRDGATVTKYGAQTLYENFVWNSNHAETLKISADGTINATKFTLKDSAIAPANGQALAIYSSDGFKRLTTQFDGSTTTKYLSQRGTFENLPSLANFVTLDTAQTISGAKTFSSPIIATDSSNIGLIVKEDSTHQTQYKKSEIVIRTINSGSTPPTDITLTYPSIGGTLAITDDIHDGSLVLKVNGTQKATFSANSNNSQAIEFDVTAADLGLSQAMSFIGVSTTDPSSTTGATVAGHSTWAKGEVVIYKRIDETYYEEYVNITGSNTSSSTPNPNWELLGDADSYAMKSITITGIGALGGGGNLADNRQITHNAGSAANKTSGWYKFSTDAYSHISGTTVVTSSDIAGFLANTGNVTFTDNNSKISASVTFPVSDVQTKTTTSGSYTSVVTSNVAKIDLSGYATTSSLSNYVSLTGTQNISGKKTFSHADGVISETKFVVDTQPITTVYEETAIVRTDNQAGNITQTLNYPAFTSTSQNLTIATLDKIKNGLLTINVNDDEQEFYANSATDVYVEITLPRVKRYI